MEVIHTQFIVKVIQLERLPKKRKKSNMEEEKAKERLLVAKNVQYSFPMLYNKHMLTDPFQVKVML